jgi:PAS domain S-box-containing protein
MDQEAGNLPKTITIKYEFDAIFSFLMEICEVSHALITYFNSDNQLLVSEKGFEASSIPENILIHNQSIIDQKTALTVSNLNSPFLFFTGLPIYDAENSAIGTICILDHKPRELTSVQQKTLQHCAQQIQLYLDLEKQNKKLHLAIKEKESQFQLFIANSKEIVYEINQNGFYIYVSKNWTTFLGYEVEEVLGKSYAKFLHPDDLGLFMDFLNKTNTTENKDVEITYRILHKEDYYVWHVSSLKLAEKDTNPIYIGNCRDVTKQIKGQYDLIKQKELYEKILDKIPTDIAVFDNNHRYLYLNPFAIRNEELRKFIIGKNDFEYAKHTGGNTISAQKRRVKFLEAGLSKSLIEWEEKFTGINGKSTYHNRKFNPVLNEDGTLDIMVGFGADITEMKQRQEEVIKNRQLLNSIIENVAVGILVQGPNSEIIENNKAACEMLGLSQDQLIGKTSYDKHWRVVHLDGTEFKSDEFPVPMAIKKSKPVKNVVMGVLRPAKNDVIWLLVDAIPVFDEFNILLYVVCSFNDITELKKIEDELKISNERFSYSSQATSDAIWDWNIITNEILVGESYSSIFGHRFNNNTIERSDYANFINPEDRDAYLKHIDEVLKSNTDKWSDQYRYIKSDGTYADVYDKAIIIRNNEGFPIRMIGALQDITNKKKLEDKLRQSEERFKGTFEHSPVGMAIMNTAGYWVEVNNRSCEILGYSKEELKKLRFSDISLEEDLIEDLANKEKLDSGKVTNFTKEKRYIRKDKTVVWVLLSVSLLRDKNGEITDYLSQIIDITERIQFENENKLLLEENIKNRTIQLNEAKNLYRLLADNTVDLVCLHNLDATLQYVSPSVKNLIGYEPEELIGKSPLDYIHPEELEEFQERLAGFIYDKEDKSQEFRFRNATGNYVWLEITANIVEENGIPVSFQTTTRDITQRKEAKQTVEKALLKERELNELRTNLVSTISHEFRTPITTIRTSAELITMYMEGNSIEKNKQIDKRISTITNEIDRLIELMNSVLTISKEDSGKTNFNPILFDLKQLCIDVVETSYSNQKDGRKVQLQFDGDNFKVLADKNLMEYSLFNLLNNAFKYSEGCGDIILKLSKTVSTILLQIIDKGIGIPQEDQQKLFNTFFRASNTNGIQGTGLGLYIVKTFTEKNSGKITLESKLGKGTKVSLKFPLQKE